MAATEPMFIIRPPPACSMRSGVKACVMAITAKKLVSKQALAVSRGTSIAGSVQSGFIC